MYSSAEECGANTMTKRPKAVMITSYGQRLRKSFYPSFSLGSEVIGNFCRFSLALPFGIGVAASALAPFGLPLLPTIASFALVIALASSAFRGACGFGTAFPDPVEPGA
jgi:hypothetical protein